MANRGRAGHRASQAKVRYNRTRLDASICQNDIRRFEVPVDDACFVRSLQRFRHLLDDRPGFHQIESMLTA